MRTIHGGLGLLGERRGVLLVQLPPTLACDEPRLAYCIMSGAGLPCVLRATAPYVYVRLHGPDDQHLYAGSYADASLRWWAERIGEWRARSREVFAYFNNDGDGNAVHNALALRWFLGA